MPDQPEQITWNAYQYRHHRWFIDIKGATFQIVRGYRLSRDGDPLWCQLYGRGQLSKPLLGAGIELHRARGKDKRTSLWTFWKSQLAPENIITVAASSRALFVGNDEISTWHHVLRWLDDRFTLELDEDELPSLAQRVTEYLANNRWRRRKSEALRQIDCITNKNPPAILFSVPDIVKIEDMREHLVEWLEEETTK